MEDPENLLTEQEKQDLADLKRGYNIVVEHNDPITMAANRVELSRKWSGKLLKIAFFMNMITLLCYLASAVFIITKPEPAFYASTPSGKVIPLKKIYLK